MVFSANPLSLSVPEPAFEAWLRDTGYLEILDERTSTATSSTDPSPPSSSSQPPLHKTTTATLTKKSSNFFTSLISFFRTLISLFTLNPFAKLTPDDFASETPSWTLGFIGRADSYSWPAGPSQARMRVQENVRRYARNYVFLSLIFFACSLYRMPISLLGLILSLGLWELLRFCSNKWELDEQHPGLRQVLVRLVQFEFQQKDIRFSQNCFENLTPGFGFWLISAAIDHFKSFRSTPKKWDFTVLFFLTQVDVLFRHSDLGAPNWRGTQVPFAYLHYGGIIATAVILYSCNFQIALICALIVSYTVMILHASLRKLAPPKQSIGTSRHKRFQQRKVHLTAK